MMVDSSSECRTRCRAYGASTAVMSGSLEFQDRQCGVRSAQARAGTQQGNQGGGQVNTSAEARVNNMVEGARRPCPKCGLAKPETDDFFLPIRGKDRFHAACRDCLQASARRRWAARRRATGIPCLCGCGQYPVTIKARYVLGHFHPRGTLGRIRSAPATVHPSVLDIAWAAGIYEGEGSAGYSGISVSQSDRWILDRFKELFGGTVSYERSIEMHFWRASGARARGFLMTIYGFLSPWRRIKAADAIRMVGSRPRRRQPKAIERKPRSFPERRRRLVRTTTL